MKPDKSAHYLLGIRGEEYARDYLIQQHYRILHTHYTNPYGEIDIIAKEKKTLCFIEVKTRSTAEYGIPAEAITPRKRKRIINGASAYLAATDVSFKECRFDVIELSYEAGDNAFTDLVHIKDAFIVE